MLPVAEVSAQREGVPLPPSANSDRLVGDSGCHVIPVQKSRDSPTKKVYYTHTHTQSIVSGLGLDRFPVNAE